jgi:hypothetical protein
MSLQGVNINILIYDSPRDHSGFFHFPVSFPTEFFSVTIAEQNKMNMESFNRGYLPIKCGI